MSFLDFTCYHGNHSVESALTKIIKITNLCNFFSFVLVHNVFPIIIVDMLHDVITVKNIFSYKVSVNETLLMIY